MVRICFLRWKEFQFSWSRWLSEVLACKNFPEENYSTKQSKGGSLMMWGEGFSSSEKLKLQFVSSRQKAADHVKIVNDLSLAQEGCRLCGEEWIFQQDNSVIHNASIIKKYSLEQKISPLDHPACSPDLSPIENLWGLIVAKVYEEGSNVLSNFWTQKCNVWCLSVQLWKLVDCMPSQIFEIIKANSRSTK